MNRLLFFLLVSILTQGCQLFGEEEEQGIFLETDRMEYDRQDTVRVSLRNITGNELSGGICELYLERQTSIGWQRVVDPTIDEFTACPDVGRLFEPGGIHPVGRQPVQDWMELGIYRFQYNVGIDDERVPLQPGELPDRIFLYTEPFEIVFGRTGVKV